LSASTPPAHERWRKSDGRARARAPLDQGELLPAALPTSFDWSSGD